MGRIRRQDLYLPVAKIIDKTIQLQPDVDILRCMLVIVIEQVKNQSPAVGFSSKMAQDVTAWLQPETRPSRRGLGTVCDARSGFCAPNDDASTRGEHVQLRLLLVVELGQVGRQHQHLEPVQRNSLIEVRKHFGLEKNALLKEFVGYGAIRLSRNHGDRCCRLSLVIQFLMLGQEAIILSDGRPSLLGIWFAHDQSCEESALDVARGGRAERVGLGNRKLLLGWARDAALARAAVVQIVLIFQGLPSLLLAA